MRTLILAAAALIACFAPSANAQSYDARVTLQTDRPGAVINPNIYGQFVEHLGRGVYEGIWVGEDSEIPNVRGIRSDVVAALRHIRVPLIRWPGGCFGEIYHWRDGIGPRDQRPQSVNSAWGDEAETNAFGTHEFMDFLDQIGAKAFVSVNLASGTPGEARDWIQYMTEPATSAAGRQRAANGRTEPWDVPFIGIGNETWGCGGNMTADYYSDLYRHYASVLPTRGTTLVAADANSDDYAWTETLLQRALIRHANAADLRRAWVQRQPMITMMGIHFYSFAGDNWGAKSPTIGFTEQDWAHAMERGYAMDELITRHSAIMDRYDPQKRIALSVNEWGTWWATDPNRPSNLYQQNTLRDAVMAGFTLNIFHNHAERVKMANIAQMVNVLQAMILTRGPEMVLTPTYHVFDMYQPHQGATLIPTNVRAPNYAAAGEHVPSVSVSASRNAEGVYHISLVNLDPTRPANVTIDTPGITAQQVSGRLMTADAMDAHNDFGSANTLAPVAFTGATARAGAVELTLPAKSIVTLEVRG